MFDLFLQMLRFTMDVIKAFWQDGVSRRSWVDQMYQAGVTSLPTTIISGLFVGAIMAIQIQAQLRDFGAESVLGGIATSVTIRNIGPVLIAFLLCGKVGAFTTSELGTMAVTDQIDAVKALGLNPISYLVVPRLVAVSMASFLLLVIGLLFTLAGGVFISAFYLGINRLEYLGKVPQFVGYWSIAVGVTKSLVFGFYLGCVCCYYGYHTTHGSKGIGANVRKNSVVTLIGIIVLDFFVSRTFTTLEGIFSP